MILHLADWLKYPTARPDWDTSNKSFLKLVTNYHRIGIENCHFILALVNQELKGVDPHYPYLTDEQKIAIWYECSINPWYFLREVCRVKNGDYIPYIANRGNIALTWLFLNHIDLFLIQPRQTGKSVGADCLMIWLMYFGCSGTAIQLITKDSTLRSDNVARLKVLRDGMPAYLAPKHAKDPDNTIEFHVTARGMRYKGLVPRASATDAAKVGRGATSEILQIDESPYIPHIEISLQAALGSTTAAREGAKRRGTPYGIIYTTTAGKIDSRDGGFVYGVLQSGANWTERFLDAGNEDALREMVLINGHRDTPLVNCTFSHRQLGYTDEWLWETMSRNEAKGDAAERDYLNRWTNGTGTNPLTAATLKAIADSEVEPLFTEIGEGGYITRWYIPQDRIAAFMASGSYVIGLDTSDAIGRDAISMVVIDVRSRAVVATGKYNRTLIHRWISFLASFMIKYPTTTLVIERKSSAQTIVDGLIHILDAQDINPFQRIFNHVVDSKDRYEKEFEAINRSATRRRLYDTAKGTFGFNTTGDSRTLLYIDIMNSALDEAAGLIRDKGLGSEFRGLMIKNDRIDHSAGGHDDTIIAYLLANWMLTHGKNLSYYGINQRDVRSEIRPQGKPMTVQESMQAAKQKELKEQIDKLCEQYATTEFEFDARRIETQLRHLMAKVQGEVEIFESLNELVEKAAQRRGDIIRSRRSGASRNDAYPNLYGRAA